MRRPLIWLQDLAADLRHALRTLARRPTLSAVAIITVALGSGAVAAMMSVHDALLGRSIYAASPGDLRVIDERRSGMTSQPVGIDAIPWQRFLAYREALRDVFSGLAADRFATFAVSAPEGAVAVTGYLVSGNYFDVLGSPPTRGRYFTGDEEEAVVLGHDLWRRRFGGDEGVIGRLVRIDSRPYTIVGVAPPGFRGTLHGLDAQLWIPLGAHGGSGPSGFEAWVTFFGRLRPGVTEDQVRERVQAAATTIPPLQSHTTVRGADVAALTGIPPEVRPTLARFLLLLVATGAFVLVIAAANVAGVLVALAVSRRTEMAVRTALGAGRLRLVRHVLIETLLLFVAGSLAGIALGWMGTRLLQGLTLPIGLDVAFDLSPGPVVVAGVLAGAVTVGLLFGLVPAWQASHADIGATLKSVARGHSRPPRGWRLFTGIQVALSVVLLVTSGLFARSLMSGMSLDPGFDPEGVVIAKVDLAPHGYDVAGAQAFFASLLERLRSLPAVESAALAENVPLGATYGRNTSDVTPLGTERDDVGFNSAFTVVSEEYFRSMRTGLVAGRGFTEADLPGGTRVAVVNETFAARAWPGRSPLGRRFRQDGREYQVVGVAEDGKYGFIGEAATPYIFRSAAQEPGRTVAMTVHVRSSLPAGEALAVLRGTVRDLDPDVPLQGELRLGDLVDLTLFPQRIAAGFVGAFGLMGLLFAAVGIYGIIAFQAAQRTHEIGIRVALGAHPARLAREMTLDSIRLAGIWVVAGLTLAAVASGPLRSLMIGIASLDPLTYVAVGVGTLAVAAVASFIPSRRASAVDPSLALREE